MADVDSTLQMLQDFLSGPDAKDKISEALSMLGSGDFSFQAPEEKEHKKENNSDFPIDIDPQKLIKIMSAFKNLETKQDPRSDLLSALKPYLSKEKQPRADRAIKMVKILKYTPMLESLKDIF